MSVQIPCFAHVVAEVSTIRSGLTELLARLDQLETWLITEGASSPDRRIATESQSELQPEPALRFHEALSVGPTTGTDPVLGVSADVAIKALCEDAMRQRDADATIAPDCPLAIEAALNDAMGPAAGCDTDEGSTETHSLLVAAQTDAAPAVDMPDEAEVVVGDRSVAPCVASMSPHCEPDVSADSVDATAAAAVISAADAALHQSDDEPSVVTRDGTPATLPAVVAAELADKAARGDAVSHVDPEAGVPDCKAPAQPPVAASPALAVASPSTSLVVLPCPEAAPRSPSRPVGRRIMTAIAASLIICVAVGAEYRLVVDRWSDTLRLAVDETVRSLPALWQRAAAHEAADTQAMLDVSHD